VRRFEMRDGKSQKFWEVDTSGTEVVVRFGRLGTKGQEKRTATKSDSAARAAAEKLVREKLAKGYVEIASASAPASASASRCFLPADDALFARGFPDLHVLTDETVPPAKAIARATEAIDAIDPRLPVVVPRDVARRFVLGYLVGRTWGYGPKVTVVALPDRVREREAALASDAPIDVAALDRFLEAHCPCPLQWKTRVGDVEVSVQEDDTYGWRLQEIIHVFEAFLGTALVADKLRDRLLFAHRQPDAWKHWAHDPWRHNAPAHHLAFALGTLRPRMSADAWRALVTPFRDLESDRLLVFSDLLACLADDARAPKCPFYPMELAVLRRDAHAIVAVKAPSVQVFHRSQLPWMLGPEAFANLNLGAIRRLPDWLQVRFVDEVGRIAMPEIARFIATLVSARPGKRAAVEWLVAHEEYARPILEDAAATLEDEDDRARMKTALDAMASAKKGKLPAAPKTLTEDELDREMAEIFDTLEEKLEACRGKHADERRVMRTAFDRYCEARAAAGIVDPGVHFGHELIEWDPKNAKARDRWFDLVSSVMNE
jgi:predicted DNA-binding WGR domain protein